MQQTLAIVAGDRQWALRGAMPWHRDPSEPAGGWAYFNPLSVKLTDASGVPAAGGTVNWALQYWPQIATGPMPLEFGREYSAGGLQTQTDATGVATLNLLATASTSLRADTPVSIPSQFALRAAGADGPLLVRASCGNASALFHLVVGPVSEMSGESISLVAVSGDNQSGACPPNGTFAFRPPQVLVSGGKGEPAANRRVSWWVVDAAKSMTLQLSAPFSLTDNHGIATLPDGTAGWCVSGGTGTATVQAAVDFAVANFHLALANLTLAATTPSQVSTRWEDRPGINLQLAGLSVLLSDQAGRPVPNIPVTFDIVNASDGLGLIPGQLSVATGVDGTATCPPISFAGAGSVDIVASLRSVAGISAGDSISSTFHCQILPWQGTIAIVSGDGQNKYHHPVAPSSTGYFIIGRGWINTTPVNPAIGFDDLSIQLTRSDGSPGAGLVVAWTCDTPGIAIKLSAWNGTFATDNNGVARVGLSASATDDQNGVRAVGPNPFAWANGAFAVTASFGGLSKTFHLRIL